MLGKIDIDFFEGWLKDRRGAERAEVLAPPAFGVDVSLVDLGDGRVLALTSDPLSLIPRIGLEASAWLSVHLLANDMATTGFWPSYAQFVLNLPTQFSTADLRTYWQYIHQFCAEIGLCITGGHTGWVEGQNSTVAGGGTSLTIAPRDKVRLSSYARVGEAILVTKSCGWSTAALLALCFPQTVKERLGNALYQRACESFYQLSVWPEVNCALGTFPSAITAMHDVTEGGVIGAIYELASACGAGAVIDAAKLPVGAVQEQVCQLFGLDPRRCIGAGALVMTCSAGQATAVVDRLGAAGIACAEVGTLTPFHSGVQLLEDGVLHTVEYLRADPYWAAFYQAMHAGWT